MSNPLRILQTFDRHLTPAAAMTLFACARVPEVEEIRQLFLSAQPKVLKLAGDLWQ